MLRASRYVEEVVASTSSLPTPEAFAEWQKSNWLRYDLRLMTPNEASSLDHRFNSVKNGFVLAHWDGDNFEIYCSSDHLFTTFISRKYSPLIRMGAVFLLSALVPALIFWMILNKQKQMT